MTCKETMAMHMLPRGRRSVPLLLGGLVLLTSACSKPADPAAEAPAAASPKVAAATVDAAAIQALANGGGEWLNYGRTYSEQRFSPLQKINADSVKDLGLSWYIDLDNSRGLQATPLFHDGVLYTTLSWSRVMAIDARTGKTLWFFDPEVKKIIGEKACCGVNNRGVALWKGKVFVGTLDGRLIALDASSGKPLWSEQTTDNSRPYTITGAPRVVKGKVLIGNGEIGRAHV